MEKITESEAFALCKKMREAGFLVVIWTPEEIENVQNINGLQDRITELGNETIAYMEDN